MPGLNPQGCDVGNFLYVPRSSAALSDKVRTSPGAHFLDHLAADGAGFPGGQVTIVAVGQVDAHFPWCSCYILNSPFLLEFVLLTGCKLPLRRI